ncbi:putative Pre-rRNA-processing protein ESF1 [Podospora australis]|uniref:Pre-rRNA-processing protein ESF1 n=1 Tax=Podospora australis TaxID=1536484 RepID=A0AAN6WTJ1_9PEZI|nr:putative Pre-rRNA-processing protein ESF1 [Podospora australis]
MSKQKPTKKGGAAPKAPRIKDERFANFETDPRFQLPSKKNLKTKIDKRFARVFEDDEFTATAKVDRYGRKLKTDSKKKALQRLYQDEDDEEEEDDNSEVEDAQVEKDDIVRRELEKADGKQYDPAREGGFSSSEDDSDSDSDSDNADEDDEADLEDGEEDRPGIRLRREKEEVPTGEITNRFAVVNIDWDHIKSVDLMALFSSFVPAGGRIEKVSIYPSEFGKERMQREELEGPPQEIFKKNKDDSDDSDDDDSDSESPFGDEDDNDEDDSDEEIKKELLQEGDDQDFDSDALRTYQLDRLRYYYAVAVCSDKTTAHAIYEATDGSEYLSSSNFLDLRFIPDDVTFDDEPRDECDLVPAGYRPVDFVTDALQHSKVKLTWDMHPEETSRTEALKKAFGGSRNEIAENDLRAYLASDDSASEEEQSEDEEEEEAAAEGEEGEEHLSKKELARRKMRAALGLPEEPVSSKTAKAAPVGEMEITFTPALSENAKSKKPEAEETTIEKYKRKEREKKEAKRQKMLAKRKGLDPDASDVEVEEEAPEEGQEEDLGFNDPFFTAAEPVKKTKTALQKEQRLKKRAQREKEEAEGAAEKAQLELLMADENADAPTNVNHFDMKEIMRAEKKSKGKGKGKKGKGKGGEEGEQQQDDFKMDVEDARFKAVFESHEFAIDPSNPKFKATQGMKKLLEEGRKKRKHGDHYSNHDVDRSDNKKKVRGGEGGDDGELSSLVESVKRKAKAGRR